MIGETLRLLRIFNDYTMVTLSEKTGISQSYISEIEKGKKQPTMQVLEKYADAFDVKPSTILLFSEMLDKDDGSNLSKKQQIAYAGMKFLKLLDRIGNLDDDEENK